MSSEQSFPMHFPPCSAFFVYLSVQSLRIRRFVFENIRQLFPVLGHSPTRRLKRFSNITFTSLQSNQLASGERRASSSGVCASERSWAVDTKPCGWAGDFKPDSFKIELHKRRCANLNNRELRIKTFDDRHWRQSSSQWMPRVDCFEWKTWSFKKILIGKTGSWRNFLVPMTVDYQDVKDQLFTIHHRHSNQWLQVPRPVLCWWSLILREIFFL